MTLAKTVEDIILKRRENLHIYSKLNPGTAALIVIDMQNAFCRPGGPIAVDAARDIVPNVNKLAKSMRAAGGPVFWIQMMIESEADWPVYLGDILSRRAPIETMLQELSPAGSGTALWPELDVQASDTIVRKNRFSAFLAKACKLGEHLEARDIDTVIIVGTLANVCCESSARDAAMQDYKVIFASDANAARTESIHAATLETIAQYFGDVRSTEEIVGMIEAGARA